MWICIATTFLPALCAGQWNLLEHRSGLLVHWKVSICPVKTTNQPTSLRPRRHELLRQVPQKIEGGNHPDQHALLVDHI